MPTNTHSVAELIADIKAKRLRKGTAKQMVKANAELLQEAKDAACKVTRKSKDVNACENIDALVELLEELI